MEDMKAGRRYIPHQRVLLILFSVVFVVFIAACGVFGLAGSSGGQCDDNVWIQAVVNYPAAGEVDIAVSTFAQMCDAVPVITAVAQDDTIGYVAGDPQMGHTFVFTVISDGPLKDRTVSCNAHPKGIELTYMRMEIDFIGNLTCGCGFEEFYVNNPIDSCV